MRGIPLRAGGYLGNTRRVIGKKFSEFGHRDFTEGRQIFSEFRPANRTILGISAPGNASRIRNPRILTCSTRRTRRAVRGEPYSGFRPRIFSAWKSCSNVGHRFPKFRGRERLVRLSQPHVTGLQRRAGVTTRSIRCHRRRSWSVIQSRLAHAAWGRSLNRASGKPLPQPIRDACDNLTVQCKGGKDSRNFFRPVGYEPVAMKAALLAVPSMASPSYSFNISIRTTTACLPRFWRAPPPYPSARLPMECRSKPTMYTSYPRMSI